MYSSSSDNEFLTKYKYVLQGLALILHIQTLQLSWKTNGTDHRENPQQQLRASFENKTVVIYNMGQNTVAQC